MLVLTRKREQSIFIGNDIEIKILNIRGDQVRIGIKAPNDVPIYRDDAKFKSDRRPVISPTQTAA